MQQRRASDLTSLFEHRRRTSATATGVGGGGGGCASGNNSSSSDGHLSFMAQVKMRLKKEKPNGRPNYNNSNQQQAEQNGAASSSTSSSLSPPHRSLLLVPPRRPFSCDVETLVAAEHRHSSRQQQQAHKASLGNCMPSINGSHPHLFLSSVSDHDDDPEEHHNAQPPMATEEDFALDSNSSSTTISYLNLAPPSTGRTQSKNTNNKEDGSKPPSLVPPTIKTPRQSSLDIPRASLGSNEKKANGLSTENGGGWGFGGGTTCIRTSSTGQHQHNDQCSRGRCSNYSNRCSTVDAQPPPQQQQQQQQQRGKNRVSSGSWTNASSSLEQHQQQGFIDRALVGRGQGGQAGGGGVSSDQQQPQAASSNTANSSLLLAPSHIPRHTDHLKCQNVVVSVTSFDDDLNPIATSFPSTSFHTLDRPAYQRSSSAQQKQPPRSPRGSLRRGKAVDLSSYEQQQHHHQLHHQQNSSPSSFNSSTSNSPVKDKLSASSITLSTGTTSTASIQVPRSKRSSILRKLIGGGSSSGGSRNCSGEEAGSNYSGSPSSTASSSTSPNSLMAQSGPTSMAATSQTAAATIGLGARAGSSAGMPTTGSGYAANDPVSARSADFSSDSSDFKYEERVRRRIFAHYDCVSISADARPLLNGTSRLKEALTNSATGASQASKPFLISAMSNTTANGKTTQQQQNVESGLLSPDDAAGSLVAISSLDQTGVGKCNDILLGCPYFRNEIGGEPIRHVSLTRDTFSAQSTPQATRNSTISCSCPSCLYPYDHDHGQAGGNSTCLATGNSYHQTPSSQSVDESQETWHRAATAAEASVLENLSNVYLGGRLCAKRQPQLVIEHVDHGAFYYRHCFSGRAHQNYFGIDENLGPLAISVFRDKLEMCDPRRVGLTSPYLYRLIVRLSDLTTFRGAILEESLPSYLSAKETREQQSSGQSSGQQMSMSGQMAPGGGMSSVGSTGGGCGPAGSGPSAGSSGGGAGSGGYARGKIPMKELLELAIPELQVSCLRLAVPVPRTEELLLKLDEQAVYTRYKVGILYCRAQQSTEEQMYNNEMPGPAFDEFLDMLGQRVRLKGFDKYKGGLDCKGDTTGSYSLYTCYQQYEVMFHVSTMLPFTPQNRQQLARKRHIGNDIVTVVFQEPGALPFSPQTVRSHFQHVFIVVRAHKPNTDNVRYSVAVSRCKDVPRFGPPIPLGATFPKSKDLRDFLLTKIINAENAVHKSEKFAIMAARTRREFMRDLAENHTTSHTLDGGPGGKIASILLGGGTKRKDRPKPKLYLDAFVRGAIVWEVQVLTQVEDFSLCRPVECYMGVSADNIVLIEQSTQEALFCTPTHSIIGWTSHGNSLKLYYDHADVIILRTLDDEDSCEMQEILKRLQAVTKGCETIELILRRGPQGQLGFNIQHEGIVSDVEMYGYAWQAGLRQGSRIVEICKVSVATLTYERMLDLLRTSVNIRVLVVPPLLEDGSPRRGCEDPYCSAVLGDEWPLVAAGSFSTSRGNVDVAPPTQIASRHPSIHVQERKPSTAGTAASRLPGPIQGYETLARRSLGTASAMGQHQAILRSQAKSEAEANAEFPQGEGPDYGYESGTVNGISSKSLDDIQHRRDRRHSEDIRSTLVDPSGFLGVANRYRPSTARALSNLPDDRWYVENPMSHSELSETLITPGGGRTDTLSSSGSSEVSTDLGDVVVKRKPTRPSELKRRVDRANSDMLQRVAAVSSVLERTSTDPTSSAAAVGTLPRAPPLPPRSTRNLKCNSAQSAASSGVGGSASDRSSTQSLHSGTLSVPANKQRSSSTGSSVQDNLIRLISDLESAGDIEEAMVISSALQRLSEDVPARRRLMSPGHHHPYRTGSPRSMRQRSPEKERGAEWSSLVDAAARAIEGLTSHRSASGSNSGSPELSGYRLRLQAAIQRIKLLEDKVDRVQSELDAERESKRDMEIDVLRLRDVNKRLEEECTHAKMELKKFTEWFFTAVENSAGSAGDLSGSRFPSGIFPFADESDRKS